MTDADIKAWSSVKVAMIVGCNNIFTATSLAFVGLVENRLNVSPRERTEKRFILLTCHMIMLFWRENVCLFSPHQVHFWFHMSCFCCLVVFLCSSWRLPWDSSLLRGALPAGGTSAHCLKVSGVHIILYCCIMNSPTSLHLALSELAWGSAIFACEN